MKRILVIALLLTIAACQPIDGFQEPETPVVRTQEVNYGMATGFYAEPTAVGDYPGVVLIHEWWGLNDGMKEAAKKVAAEGYRVLAVDLYHGQVATTPEEARTYVGGVNQAEATANIAAATAYLRENDDRVAVWGYCFGGGQAMRATVSAADPDAVVIYYGQLNESGVEEIDAPMLLVYGTEDTSTTVAMAESFTTAATSEGVDVQLHIYEGVGHAFANPSNAKHDPAKTADAWEKTIAFLKANVG
jgi:carboxymethylenebutenolidase